MLMLRVPKASELPTLSDLCLRSKGYWGYDAEFLEACREVLTIQPGELKLDHVWVAENSGGIAGVLHVQTDSEEAVLDKLFIDPDAMGLGAGRALFDKAVEIMKSDGAKIMSIDADPEAAGFYRKMGAITVGRVPSTVIEGRTLPLMRYSLEA
tara:strand:+ start:608 stop:1066 length:459 start_codon:yes stop_codon:yes gene_type:complete